MGVSDITSPSAVRQAMEEFDAIGRDAFLKKYGFGHSRKFTVTHLGNQYDSKPILAAAHGHQYPDRGPLTWRAFNGGAQTVDRLHTLGFECESPVAGPDVSFTAEDSHLFARYSSKMKWGPETVPPEDQAAFRDVRTRLRALAQWASDEVAESAPLTPFVSTLQPNGYTPQDMWCCVFSQEAPNKSYALQAALIVGAGGGEACICLGAGHSQLTHAKAAKAQAYYSKVQRALEDAPPDVVDKVERLLPEGVRYLTAWRDPSAEPAFRDFREWLDYAAGPGGAQAAISVHFTPEELAAAGTEVGDVLLVLVEAAVPLFQHISSQQVSQHSPGEHAHDAQVTAASDEVQQEHAGTRLFSWQELRRAAQEAPQGLELDDEVYRSVTAAIRAGKHVILTGPPGTAKTTLAEITCSLAAEAGMCEGYLLTTATADWTTYETIGGLQPTASGSTLEFRPGHFLEAFESNRWLVVDELNRSNFDRAFGQLFTVLSGQSVVLPYESGRSGKRVALVMEGGEAQYPPDQYRVMAVPPNWRILATMNVFDKSLLFEMSYALMRRFAFIEVPPPPPAVFQDLWVPHLQALGHDDRDRVAAVLTGLLSLRDIKDIGPAVFIDMAKFAQQYVRGADAWSGGYLSYQLFFSYLLPQFEGIDNVKGRELYKTVGTLVGASLRERLRITLADVLGVVLKATPGQTTHAEGDGLSSLNEAIEPGQD